MIRRLLAPIMFLVVVLFVGGCVMIPVPIPGHVQISREVKGRVIDGKTKSPIPGAEVTFKDYSPEQTGKKHPKAMTDSEGRFYLPADKRSYMMSFHTPCPVYHFPPTGEASDTLLVSHHGYETLEIIFSDYVLRPNLPKLPEMGDIELIPKQ